MDYGLAPGDAVLDVGAGTGIFMKALSKAVGKTGSVHAIDISTKFVEFMQRRIAREQLDNVSVSLCTAKSINVEEKRFKCALICDTYHHFEYPKTFMKSIKDAIVDDGGFVVVIDFFRDPAKMVHHDPSWALEHIRASREVFQAEIEHVGFYLDGMPDIPKLSENYCMVFKKANARETISIEFPNKTSGGMHTIKLDAASIGYDANFGARAGSTRTYILSAALDCIDKAALELRLTPSDRASARSAADRIIGELPLRKRDSPVVENAKRKKARPKTRQSSFKSQANALDYVFVKSFIFMSQYGDMDELMLLEDRLAAARRQLVERHKEEIASLQKMQAAEMELVMSSGGSDGVEALVEVHVSATQRIQRERGEELRALEQAQRKAYANETLIMASNEKKKREEKENDAGAKGPSMGSLFSNFEGLSFLGAANALTTLAEKGISLDKRADEVHWTEGVLLEGLDEATMNDRALRKLPAIDAYVGTQLRIPFRVYVRGVEGGVWKIIRGASARSGRAKQRFEERKWLSKLLYSRSALCGVMLPRMQSTSAKGGVAAKFAAAAEASTELHFEGLGSQVSAAIGEEKDDFGSVLVTKHSNLLSVHCAFHVPHKRPYSFKDLAREYLLPSAAPAARCAHHLHPSGSGD